MTEYYPSLKEVLGLLGEDCILVGSATHKPESECKDFDFVINRSGVDKLMTFDYYLYKEAPGWWQYIPITEDAGKCVDFFYGICDIVDTSKHANRISYEQASNLPLVIRTIGGIDILSI